jgi:ATP-dependent DNA helicase RecQ
MSLIHQVLAKYFGYNQFRPLQEDIVRSVMEGNDTLALLPTGGGKSICFQVPALAKDGLCLVISPLIALMKDQEEQLKEKGIRAAAIVSGMKKSEVEIVLGNCIYGDYKFLYVSPERLASEYFQEQLIKMPVSMIAVDEAHCISQWGYDFRPPYLEIANVREMFPKIPIMALTASATTEVRDDICNRLKFKPGYKIFTKSFGRSNLSYVVRHEDNKYDRMMRILNTIPGTSIVYVRNRKKTQDIANWLMSQRVKADFYHAGLDFQTRTEKQNRWMKNEIRVIVSTNAFGMGINKPDVRSVIHLDLPDDLESYYQEAGRAGRDEKPAYAVVLYNNNDLEELERKKTTNFPEVDEIKSVYQALSNYLQIPLDTGEGQTYEFDLLQFCANYKKDPVKTYNCLKILELADYLTLSEALFLPSRIKILLKNIELYAFQVERKEFEPIIKVLLRSYGGIFDEYVRISETEIARRLECDKKVVVDLLQRLNKFGILNYLPSTDQPRITFNCNREDIKYLRISKEYLEDRKNRFVVRADAFKNFISNKHQCRSIMILSYFGEENLKRCGTCDYCRELNKMELNEIEFENIKNSIFSQLENEPMSPHELVKHIQSIHPDKVTTVIQWMLESGYIKTDVGGQLAIITKE